MHACICISFWLQVCGALGISVRSALPPARWLLVGVGRGLLARWPWGGWLASGGGRSVGVGPVGRLLALVLACGLSLHASCPLGGRGSFGSPAMHALLVNLCQWITPQPVCSDVIHLGLLQTKYNVFTRRSLPRGF